MSDSKDNPLLATEGCRISPALNRSTCVPAVQQRLAEALAKLETIEKSAGPNWESTIGRAAKNSIGRSSTPGSRSGICSA